MLEGLGDLAAPLQPESSALPHEAYDPERFERPRLGARLLGRGLSDDRRQDDRHARKVRRQQRHVLNILDVIHAGADGAAVVSAIMAQPDIKEAAHELKTMILNDRRMRL